MTDRALGPRVKIVPVAPDVLGESPIWSSSDAQLFRVDVTAPAVRAYRPADNSERSWSFGKPVAAVAPTYDGRVLVVSRRSMCLLDPESDTRVDIGVTPLNSEERFNDGCCDRKGRYWVGTFHRSLERATGALYMVEYGRIQQMDGGFGLSNGITWSPDDRTMYFADTHARCIHAYEFDLESGEPGNRRIFARFDGPGRPDGITIDSDGFLWVALVGGGEVCRLDPAGRLVHTVKLPIDRPTSCAFGGESLATLFVTSMRNRSLHATSDIDPLEGQLFAIEGLPVVGIRESSYQTGPSVAVPDSGNPSPHSGLP